MKKCIYVMVLTMLLWNCSSDDDAQTLTPAPLPAPVSSCTNGPVCNVALANGETAGSVAASVVGNYTLNFDEIQTGGPFPDAAVATAEVTSDNKLIFTYNGDCVTVENPFQTSAAEVVFRDNCQFDVRFAVSESSNGGLNEINVFSFDGSQFFGQFKE